MKFKIIVLMNSMVFFAASAMQQPAQIKVSVSIPASASLQNHTQRVSSVVFLPNNRIASGSLDKTVVITDLNTQQQSQTLSNLGIVMALDKSPTNNLLEIGSASQAFPLFYDYQQKKFIGGNQAPDSASADGVSALTVVNPLTVATGHLNGSVVVILGRGVGMGGDMVPFNLGHPINAIATSTIERILATSAKANVIFMINPRAKNVTQVPLPAGFTAPRSLAVLSQTRWAIGLMDGRILILDSTTGMNQMRVLQGHTGAVQALSAINQTFLVSGSVDGTARVWNAETAKELFSLKPAKDNQGAVFAVASEWDASTNNARVIAGYANGTVSVWKNVSLPK